MSAKMFCASAAHPIRPARSALVVGDPLGDLANARAEARAIYDRFYPHGRYLGPPHATPDEVVEWLASAAGPSTLHFACHGRVDMNRPADAHLVLDGGMLTARRLLDASRVNALVLNRVFLAACTTNVGGADYDEAFSLATAFLAAGAHTVLGSLWAVPDEATSVLMFMVHHYLNAESCAPAEALHRAQLWMLDPAREAPHTMPPALRATATHPECADPLAWAAFTHLGR